MLSEESCNVSKRPCTWSTHSEIDTASGVYEKDMSEEEDNVEINSEHESKFEDNCSHPEQEQQRASQPEK